MIKEEKYTGERLETHICNDSALEHLHRYAFTFPFIKGLVVLDIASGEGYGSSLMADHAASVTGMDIDKPSVEAAEKKYRKNNLHYKLGDATKIPLQTHSIDVVVSFETIEHHDKHHEMLREIKRVLKPDGILIISTPEKKAYSDDRNYQNPYHVKEFYLQEFKDFIKQYFNHVITSYQESGRFSILVPEELSLNASQFFEVDYNKVFSENSIKPKYILSVASDAAIHNDLGLSIANMGDKIDVQTIAAARQGGIDFVKNSFAYKVGNFVTAPLRFLRSK